MLFALSSHGYLDEAYLMLLRREAPSWLYQVDRGATTVWERWDAILPDGSIHSGAMDALPSEEVDREEGSMLSFNHYAYGAMIDWVYRTVGGLAPDLGDPGYRTVHVAPRPAEGLDRASRVASRPAWAGSPSTGTSTTACSRRRSRCRSAPAPLLDLPVTDESTVDGRRRAGARAELAHGTHRIRVTAPAVAYPSAAVVA